MSAAVMYALLRRLGTRPWLATLGVAGLLLDAYQVNIEQFVMAETLAEALTVLAMAALLWREPPTVALSAVAGLLLATAVLTRTVSIVMILPALALSLGRRWGLRRCIALCSFTLLPLATYATWFQHVHGRFALESFGGRLLYGRVQAYLPCDRASLPPEEQPLCVPPVPLTGPTATDPAAGGGPLYFAWNQNSPIWQLRPAGSRTVNDIAQRYALRQILRHPTAYARSLGASLLRIFAPTRATRAGEWPIQSWQFLSRTDPPRWHVAVLPAVPDRLAMPDVARLPPVRARPPVGLLHHYQRWAYVPGPALAAAVATVLSAWLRTRRSEDRPRWAMGTLAAAGGLLLLLPVATSGVDFRYLLPALTVLPPVAALAGELLLRQGRPVHRGIQADAAVAAHRPLGRRRPAGTAPRVGLPRKSDPAAP